ncbi:YrhB domain-containing protein [Streptomyces sp. NPDC020875]|uniref:YrhB domain-containing protein n=1 Tax=Streptomyces sp. NPDC020875 TaxID=3154898 RepID=UPI0033F14276
MTPVEAAHHWLQQTYRGPVELAVPQPVAQDGATWLFGCRTVVFPGRAAGPMLAASLVVPKDGGVPFHPAADDPFGDAAAYPRTPPELRAPQARARRLNARGWLFAVETVARLRGGDWRDAMVDAAVVVPKGAQQPFLLPNDDPWGYFAAWDRGDAVGPTPEPGPAAWFGPTLRKLGSVLSVSEHRDVGEAMAGLFALPPGARALVWLSRLDGRGRSSTGLLLTGVRTPDGGAALLDGSARPLTDLRGLREHTVRVIRYR